jgi:hypothetical protein
MTTHRLRLTRPRPFFAELTYYIWGQVNYDSWGSWKWIGWFGTESTWVGRCIMDSVIRKDTPENLFFRPPSQEFRTIRRPPNLTH